MPGKGKIRERDYTTDEAAGYVGGGIASTADVPTEAHPRRTLILYRALTARDFGEFKRSGQISIEQPMARGATTDLRKAQDYARQRGPGARIIKFVTQLNRRWITDAPEDPGEYRIRAPFKPLNSKVTAPPCGNCESGDLRRPSRSWPPVNARSAGPV
jgi:hypothetical protein